MPASYLANLGRELDAAAAGGYKLEIFLDHGNIPSWVNDKWPGSTNDSTSFNKFINYDMDSPGFVGAFVPLLQQVASFVGPHPAFHSFMLCNEPYFYGASAAFSLPKYRTWLAAAYSNNVSALNGGWGTAYAFFADVGASHLRVPDNWGSTRPAEQYDFSAWNSARVVSWAATMDAAVRAGAPSALTHIKFIDELIASPDLLQPHHLGLDREALLGALSANGCDSSANDPPRNGVSTKTHPARGSANCDEALHSVYPYGLTWLDVSLAYDFQRSLAPSKPLIDSEWHSDSTASPAAMMAAAHAYGGLWLLALQGLAATQQWYWGRLGGTGPPSEDGGKWTWEWFPYSIAQQPALLDATARALGELNAIAALIPPLVLGSTSSGTSTRGNSDNADNAAATATATADNSTPASAAAIAIAPFRPLAILWSEASAALDVEGSLCTTVVAYEAAFFLGLPIGFVTDAGLSGEGSRDSTTCEGLMHAAAARNVSLIIPAVSHVSDATVACIAAFAAAGGDLVLIAGGAGTTNSSLAYSRRGVRRAASDIAWLDSVPRITAGPGQPCSQRWRRP